VILGNYGAVTTGDRSVGVEAVALAPEGRPDDLEAEVAEVRRQARRHSSEISALVERLNELQLEIRQHQAARGGPPVGVG
jgi:chromosome segregation ATPase